MSHSSQDQRDTREAPARALQRCSRYASPARGTAGPRRAMRRDGAASSAVRARRPPWMSGTRARAPARPQAFALAARSGMPRRSMQQEDRMHNLWRFPGRQPSRTRPSVVPAGGIAHVAGPAAPPSRSSARPMPPPRPSRRGRAGAPLYPAPHAPDRKRTRQRAQGLAGARATDAPACAQRRRPVFPGVSCRVLPETARKRLWTPYGHIQTCSSSFRRRLPSAASSMERMPTHPSAKRLVVGAPRNANARRRDLP